MRAQQGRKFRAAGAALGAGAECRAKGLDGQALSAGDGRGDGVGAHAKTGADRGAGVGAVGRGLTGQKLGQGLGAQQCRKMRPGRRHWVAVGEQRGAQSALIGEGDAVTAARRVCHMADFGLWQVEEVAGKGDPVRGRRTRASSAVMPRPWAAVAQSVSVGRKGRAAMAKPWNAGTKGATCTAADLRAD